MPEQLGQLTRLEELAGRTAPFTGCTPAQNWRPPGCTCCACCRWGGCNSGRLAPYLLDPVVVLSLAEVPLGLVLRRAALALPFCAFAGLSNLLLERQVLLWLGPVPVTVGLASCGVLLLRALLCVSAVLALAAVTPIRAAHRPAAAHGMPSFCVALLEMLYRYLGLLAGQAGSMLTAYRLRGGSGTGLPVGHMGSFIGQLLLQQLSPGPAGVPGDGMPRWLYRRQRSAEAPLLQKRLAVSCGGLPALPCGTGGGPAALLGRLFVC